MITLTKEEQKVIYKKLVKMELDGSSSTEAINYLKEKGFKNPWDKCKKIKSSEAYKYLLTEEMKKRMKKNSEIETPEEPNVVIEEPLPFTEVIEPMEEATEERTEERTEHEPDEDVFIRCTQMTGLVGQYQMCKNGAIKITTSSVDSIVLENVDLMVRLAREMIKASEALGRFA